MKNFITNAFIVFVIAMAVFLLVWALPSTSKPPSPSDTPNKNESKLPETSAINSEETSDISESELLLFDRYIGIIKDGIYKQIVEHQRHIGGYSVPVKTVTYFGDGFINILENEMHNIATEIFVNKTGAYHFNENGTEATLMESDSVDLQSFPHNDLTFIKSGKATLGLFDYTFERYETGDGTVIEYMFLDGELKKAKIYDDFDNDEYELFSLEISTDMSGARTSLPYGIAINDLRNK